jgi:hypothetical protein
MKNAVPLIACPAGRAQRRMIDNRGDGCMVAASEDGAIA